MLATSSRSDRIASVSYGLLGDAARKALQELMATTGYQYQSDFARKYVAQGRTEGEATLLLKLLEMKGFTVGDSERERVLGCDDSAQIEAWAARALVARTLDEIFADE